jgi:hypothetical protein
MHHCRISQLRFLCLLGVVGRHPRGTVAHDRHDPVDFDAWLRDSDARGFSQAMEHVFAFEGDLGQMLQSVKRVDIAA